MLAFLFPKTKMDPTPTDSEGRLLLFDGSVTIEFPSASAAEPGNHTRMRVKAGSVACGVKPEGPVRPPYHWHWYQTETFHVTSGTLAYILDGKEATAGPGETVVVPPGVKHTIWMPEDSADLDVTVVTSGGERAGFDEFFVRNFYGYANHCYDKKTTPNPLQMLVLVNEADVVLADPPLGLGRFFNFVFGRLIGPYIFGLSPGFKEFETRAQ